MRINREIIGTIIISVSCFVFFILIVPAYEAIKDARAVLQTRQTLLGERTELVANVKELSRQYDTRQAEIAKLAILLPTKRQLDQVISAVQAGANQNGVQLRELTTAPDNQTVSANYQKLFIKMGALGDYPSMLGWLHSIEQSLRVYDINEITVSKDNVTPGKFNLEFKFNTYNALK